MPSDPFSRYNGAEGLHTKVTEFVKDKDCLVCGPGVLIELDSSITLQKVGYLAYVISTCFRLVFQLLLF